MPRYWFPLFGALISCQAFAACLDDAAAFAERICGDIEIKGIQTVTDVNGELKAEVSGIVRKVVGDAGGAVNGQQLTDSYENVLRKDLAGDRYHARDCRMKMVTVGAAETCKNVTAAPVRVPVCTYVSIRALGWRHGHKTKFCIANGYPQGNFNQGEYKNGGICMSGEAAVCRASVTAQLSSSHYCEPQGGRTVCYAK